MGDVLLQKTFTSDYLTKRRVKNAGQQKQYYVKNHHEAIIPKTVYYKIQEEIARRSSLKKAGTRKGKTAQGVYSSKYALTGIMVCNECGAITAGQPGQKMEEGNRVALYQPSGAWDEAVP